jgi:hypothetical protein
VAPLAAEERTGDKKRTRDRLPYVETLCHRTRTFTAKFTQY